MKELKEVTKTKFITHVGYFIAAIILFLAGIVLNYTYRKFIYSNHLNDFHIADTLGSIIGIPTYTCYRLGIEKKQVGLSKIIIQGVVFFILYEFLGYFGFHGVFDPLDMVSAIVSGVITYLIFRYVIQYRVVHKP
ncbi:hypothetical protein [Carboxylicivirga linearis]|uniref:Uncharacterized protein n=1 Tax=Carboxylicivirga linearis TaxID=1628157 RepID=A0ABS5JPG1_9BACT|nr:hypothetical protein [Carboxylicivirga linearis]MBS2096784.1 hypothetical protein [Carboxylicivirga linearis]